MPALQRSVSMRGARFYLDGERVMFVRHLDGSTREGPRVAAAADQEAHAEAWRAFRAEQPAEPKEKRR